MKIFRLIPTNTVHPSWRSSIHKGPVVVRAETECDARDLAAFAFKVPEQACPLDQVLTDSPWLHAEIVDCFDAIDPSHGPGGAEEILSPLLDEVYGPAMDSDQAAEHVPSN